MAGLEVATTLSKALDTGKSLLIRTDFASDAGWREIVNAVTTPSEDGFLAQLAIVDDNRLGGETLDGIVTAISARAANAVLFIADQVTLRDPEHPILCIALPPSGRQFRVIPGALWSVENNLSLANLDFEDFCEAAGPDGIY